MGRAIEAVIFDMDGTLFDSMDPVIHGFTETIVAAGGQRYSPDEIIEAFRFGPSDRMLDHLLGRPVTAEESAGYHRRMHDRAHALAPYAGITETLGALAENMRLALFTGADVVSLRLLLGQTDLLRRFEVTTGGDEVGRAKPAADGILLTCDRLGLPPRAVAYVGDSAPDMEAARAARTLAIGAGWGRLWEPGHPAELVCAAPVDLPAALGTA